ncbi:response regulator [Halobacteriovorax sp. HLS]|uniref:response regulator n=1 Tax=Halobacteriovorax sp. HLS TaxID=2234000 RepID=UPI000FD6E118|nr:response regulator [Halobacteriovorax sp. HLS]
MSKQHVDLVIVDDDPIIGKVLMRMLEGFDLNIHFYEDSTEALSRIVEDRPRLVVLDYNMPGLDGHQLIVKFSERLIFQTTSVMLFTAEKLSEMDKIKLMTLGFEKIIAKPIEKEDFIDIIQENLGKLSLKSA